MGPHRRPARVPYASDRNKRLAEQFIRNVVARLAAPSGSPRCGGAWPCSPTSCFSSPTPTTRCRSTTWPTSSSRANDAGTAIACIEFGEGPSPRRRELPHADCPRNRRRYVYIDTAQLFSALALATPSSRRLRRVCRLGLRLRRPPGSADVVHAELGRVLRPVRRVPEARSEGRRTRVVPRELVVDARNRACSAAPQLQLVCNCAVGGTTSAVGAP